MVGHSDRMAEFGTLSLALSKSLTCCPSGMKDSYASAGVSAITQYLDFAATILILWLFSWVFSRPKESNVFELWMHLIWMSLSFFQLWQVLLFWKAVMLSISGDLLATIGYFFEVWRICSSGRWAKWFAAAWSHAVSISELCTGKWFQRRSSATGLWLRICELRIGNLITFNLYWSMLNVTFWCISVRFVATNLIPNSQRLADVNHYITRVALRTPSVASTACSIPWSKQPLQPSVCLLARIDHI